MFVYPGKLLQNMANQEEPDYFMMDYHPYRGGEGNQDWDSQTLVYLKMRNVYDQQRKKEFIQRIRKWLRGCINDDIVPANPNEEIIFGFVPGHLPRNHPDFHESFMFTELSINALRNDPHFTIDNGMLSRTQEVESQHGGGQRNIQTHLNSIQAADVNGKIVCIMDDVWTTGCTMNACTQLVAQAGAKKVYTLAIGRTVH